MENKFSKFIKKIAHVVLVILILILLGKEVSLFLGITVFIYFLHISIHELGHLIAGLISGYRLNWIRILNIVLYKKKGKYEIRYQPFPGLIGQCSMRPPEDLESAPFVLYHLGGIIANAVSSGLVSVFLMSSLPEFVRSGILIFCATGVLIVVANLVPFGSNDGKNIWNGLKSTNRRIQLNYILQISTDMMEGATFTELEKYIYYNNEEPLTDPYNVAMILLDVNRYEEKYAFQQAKNCLMPLVKNIDKVQHAHKKVVLAEYLFLSLMCSPEDKEIENFMENKWLKVYLSLKQTDTIRVLAAYALIKEQDIKKFETLIVDARSLLEKIIVPTDSKLEAQLIDYLEDIAKN
ncbi:hypothetical protein ACFP65_07905 [Marinilactibacillus sp. GCM10026970]|uniref:hypothetical protein n=1 Tax=Marinilactibacillus sp. GCM10026970 TaxID=3252642 RepID=UPI003617CFAB